MIVTTERHFNFCFPRDCYAETSKEGDRGLIIWWNIQEFDYALTDTVGKLIWISDGQLSDY